MRKVRLILGVALMGVAFLATNSITFATPEMTKKEKKPCGTCHVKAMPKKGDDALNDVGKYYKDKKSLDGAPLPKK